VCVRPLQSLVSGVLTDAPGCRAWQRLVQTAGEAEAAFSLRLTGWCPRDDAETRLDEFGHSSNILVWPDSVCAYHIPWDRVRAFHPRDRAVLRHCGGDFIASFIDMVPTTAPNTCIIVEDAHTLSYGALHTLLHTSHPTTRIRLIGAPLVWNATTGGSPYYDMVKAQSRSQLQLHADADADARASASASASAPVQYVATTWRCYPHELGPAAHAFPGSRIVACVGRAAGDAALHARIASPHMSLYAHAQAQ
jgi:hypothetical protein